MRHNGASSSTTSTLHPVFLTKDNSRDEGCPLASYADKTPSGDTVHVLHDHFGYQVQSSDLSKLLAHLGAVGSSSDP